MTSQRKSVALRTADKVRGLVNRAGFDVVRDPTHQFVGAMHAHGITAVLDVGANVGQFGAALRRTGFTGRIHSVEPLRQAFDELSVRVRGDADWTAERAALSDTSGTVQMNVSANSVSSSVLPMLGTHAHVAPQSRYVATEDVPATTVDELVTRVGLDPATTMLKIDVQGYEKSVLDGATQTLPAFVGVRTELSLTPLYDGQALLPDIITYLAEHGLELWLIEPGFRDPSTRRLLQLDGTFFRSR
jgi:FkbM family methyltransferase